ncbi:hypothetical protein ACVQ8P_07695 [Dellaglioa sp. BT-FLS60]
MLDSSSASLLGFLGQGSSLEYGLIGSENTRRNGTIYGFLMSIC